VAFELGIGDVSDVIESPMGFHIIKLLEKQACGFDMSPDLKRKIRETLYASEFEKRYGAFVKELRATSYIKIMLNAP
jgi:parvulin-like peptidyl-prolyl isomerase